MTQERSKVIRETEENPFGDDEEEAARDAAQQQAAGGSSSTGPSHGRSSSTASALANQKAVTGSSFFGSSKDKKKDKSKSKRKPFNLEAEKEQMKVVIADATITSTNLMNSLQTINRETERISDNPAAVEKFETCKQLRRRVLRYVCLPPQLAAESPGG